MILSQIKLIIKGGRQAVRHQGKKVFSLRKSIQGKWKENLFNKYPLAELEDREPLPQVITCLLYTSPSPRD